MSNESPNRISPEMSQMYLVSGDGPPEGTSGQEPAKNPVLSDSYVKDGLLILTVRIGDTTAVWQVDVSDRAEALFNLGAVCIREATAQDPLGTIKRMTESLGNLYA